MLFNGRKITFYISITALLVATVLVLTSLFLWISHRESMTAALNTADHLYSEINTKTMERYENALQSVSLVAGLAAPMPGFDIAPRDGDTSHVSMPYMLEALSHHEFIYSTYIGYTNGSFIQIIAMRDNKELQSYFKASPETAFILRIIAPAADDSLIQRWYFLDRNHRVTGQREELDPGYDPRRRIWYQQAQSEDTTFYTEPYVFSSYKVPGITCAKRLASGDGVFGVDITLGRFSRSLVQQQISDNGLLFLFDRSSKIIANPQEDPVRIDDKGVLEFLDGSQSSMPVVQAIIAEYLEHGDEILNRTREVDIDGISYLAMLTGVNGGLKFNQILASIAPISDFTGHIRQMQQRILLLCGILLVFVLPLALLVSRVISDSLTQLEQEAIKIRQRDFSESPPFDSNIKEIHTLIRAFVIMKSTIRRLLEQQRKLFDDFTKLIAGAIDAKSPYTGGHCARVPVLAEMLVDAACHATHGPFADFQMQTEDEHWEFEVAAWLHDCGKVTTPEYVVDKATKLETIYNRIHEIRMRFEVLLRDAEIEFHQNMRANGADEKLLRAQLEYEKEQIIDDFRFVAHCNIGGEAMSDEAIERLHSISKRTWVRYLDDRAGISEDESMLKKSQPPPDLPVLENVLADQYWHIIPRSDKEVEEKKFAEFNMEVPKDQYNLGELYNLSIRKGTLSEEDRFKINEHIVQTITMLRRLEFPEYLEKVPEYAGAHHETMDGTGYPRGLTREEMSIPARIMAIADIFEALTAADRPYKKPKTLSESLSIMNRMCKSSHIDGELFDLFLQSGVYRQYAERYLDPALIDEVNISSYLSSPAH